MSPRKDAVDLAEAKKLLDAERAQLKDLLRHSSSDTDDDRTGAGAQGDMSDPAPSLVAEQQDDAVARGLRNRLSAIERAQQRLRDGTYGFSVRSGEVISPERLLADPAAELTVDEALANEEIS